MNNCDHEWEQRGGVQGGRCPFVYEVCQECHCWRKKAVPMPVGRGGGPIPKVSHNKER